MRLLSPRGLFDGCLGGALGSAPGNNRPVTVEPQELHLNLRRFCAVIAICGLGACVPAPKEDPEQNEDAGTEQPVPFGMTLRGVSGGGANATTGPVVNDAPAITDNWRLEPNPAVWDASASSGAATASSHFELIRNNERSFTIKGNVSGSSPGISGVGGGGTAGFTLNVCVEETAATAFRFSFDCTGDTTQTGNSGLGSITGKQTLKTHCQRISSLDLTLPWTYQDGKSFEVQNISGACRELQFYFLASAGNNGINDNSGSATANGAITLTVDSIY